MILRVSDLFSDGAGFLLNLVGGENFGYEEECSMRNHRCYEVSVLNSYSSETHPSEVVLDSWIPRTKHPC